MTISHDTETSKISYIYCIYKEINVQQNTLQRHKQINNIRIVLLGYLIILFIVLKLNADLCRTVYRSNVVCCSQGQCWPRKLGDTLTYLCAFFI